MRNLILGVSAAALLAAAAGAANAQPGYYQNQGYGYQNNAYQHRDRGHHYGWGQDQGANHRWSNGDRMGYDDWRSARFVDYRAHNLRAPPRGYEWRQTNGQYVLAAVATGLVASIIIENGR